MTIVKLNAKNYVKTMHGRGIYGRYSRVLTKHGYGLVDVLGKSATRHVLGGVGKSTGAYYGKMLGKLIGDKTGSKLLGTIAKTGLSTLGGVAGQTLGDKSGKFLGNTIFSEKKKKKEDTPKVTLSELLERARNSVLPQSGSGINLY